MIAAQVGQRIVIQNGKKMVVATVSKVTATQITTDDGTRYLRSDGYEVGSPKSDWRGKYGARIAFSFDRGEFVLMTEEEAVKINEKAELKNKKLALVNKIYGFSHTFWAEALPEELLSTILQTLENARSKKDV